MKRILSLFWLVYYLIGIAQAQNNTGIPSTPEAYSFIQQVERPINIHTGAMSQSISLFSLDANEFKLNINLSYFSNGIKVGDIASRVGMGWSLDCGGMISCKVNNYPDVGGYSQEWEHGYETSLNPGLEQDIFYYQIPDHKGKFIVQGNENTGYVVRPITKEDIIISINSTGTEYTITDEKGIRYFFQRGEYITNKHDYVAPPVDDQGQPFRTWHKMGFYSSWFLSKIVLTNGEEIKYHYLTTFTILYEPTWGNNKYYNSALLPPGTNIVPGTFSAHSQTVSTKILTQIEYGNTKIDFTYNLSREDLQGDYALTELRVSNSNNLNKLLYLNYEFKTSFDTYLDKPAVVFKRLFLTEIKERGRFSSDEIPLYQFEYDNTPFPNRKSFRSDAWGYFNNNQGDEYVTPQIYIYPNSSRHYERYWAIPKPGNSGTELVLEGRSLVMNGALAQAGLLKKITYATGGYTTVEYEPNEFLWFDESNTSKNINQGFNIAGGGMRIKTIKNVSLGAGDITTFYKYNFKDYPSKSSGAIAYFPQYAYPAIKGEGNFSDQGLYNLSYYNKVLVRSGYNLNNINDDNAHSVGYRNVTIEQQNNGKSVHAFGFPGAYSEDIDNQATCSNDLQGYCDNLFSLTPTIQVNNVGSFSGVELQSNQPNTYPFLSNTNYDWNRGLPIKESYFDNSGNLIKQIVSKYKLFYSGEYVTDGNCLDVGYFNPIYHFQKCAIFKILLGCAKRIEEKSEITYSNGSAITDRETYVYGVNHLQPVEIEKVNSTGKPSRVKLKYSFDYPGISDGTSDVIAKAILKMQQKHILAEVEKVFTQKNFADEEKVISGDLNIYNVNPLNATLVSLPQTKRLEASAGIPVSQFQESSIINNSFFYSPSYQPYVFNVYDAKNNVVNAGKDKDISASFIWSDNGIQLIAQVVGASENQVAYSSFETDQTGSWTDVSYAATTSDLKSPSGKRYYNANSFTFYKSDVPQGTYIVSYWSRGLNCSVNSNYGVKGRTIGFWTYYEHTVSPTGSGKIIVSGSYPIDELRLFPVGAHMTSYTYDALIGLTSVTDPNNRNIGYEYDTYRRLWYTKDEYKNITKRYCYNYYNQPNNCEFPTNAPFWQPTGVTRYQPCAESPYYYTNNIREHLESDINPQSPSYGNEQWIVDGPDYEVDNADWIDDVNTVRCKAGTTIGEIEKRQRDMNPCSGTYNETRWVPAGVNTTLCPTTGNNPVYARLEIGGSYNYYEHSSSGTTYYQQVEIYLRFYADDACTVSIGLPYSVNYHLNNCGYMETLTGINTYCNTMFEGTASVGEADVWFDNILGWESLQTIVENGETIYMEKWKDDYSLYLSNPGIIIKPTYYTITHSPGY
jgi:hypothetical protein